MLPDLTRHLLDDWHNFFPSQSKPRDLQYVGISGSVEGGTVTFIAFSASSSTPLFAVKIHRDPLAGERVLNEQHVLGYLDSNGMSVSTSVPRIILCKQIGPTWVVVQSILQGQPMGDNGLDENPVVMRKVVRNLDMASTWLEQLCQRTRTQDPSLTRSLLETSQATIDSFAATFDLSVQERDVVHAIREGLEGIISDAVVVQHRDFIRENILLTETETVNVIDWTDSRRAGFPLHDLFFFLTNYFTRLGNGKGIEHLQSAFLNTFYTANPYSTLVKNVIHAHCHSIGCGQASLDLMFGSFLIEHAMYEYNKSQRYKQRGSVPKSVVHLAAETDCRYVDALRQQSWIHFFRVFAQQHLVGVSIAANAVQPELGRV